ncbi:MAG TPA: class I adenylate-forming enzyme family protein [Xanthobacteraceae bacterium]
MSFARLARFIHNIGARAMAAGIRPGQIVAIQVKDQIFHAAIALALARMGVATLSVGDLNLPAGLRADSVITDAPAATGRWTGLPTLLADLSWTEGDGKPIDERFVSPGGDAIARIVLTSGSTGMPKAIAISHRMERRRYERYPFSFGDRFAQCSRFFSDTGIGQSTCFRLLTYILSRGGTFFFPGASPMDSLQTFELYKVQGLFASPGGLSGILKFYEENHAFRSGFKTIITAGSPLPKPLSERVRARLGSDLVFFYGTTETAMAAAAPAHTVADTPGAVGYVMPRTTVEIVDGSHRALPPGQEGSVRIRGTTVVDGYFGDPEQTRASFRDGCFYPGDLGYLTADGMLVISGREREVLNLGGTKTRPQLVEDVLCSFGAVDQAAVFSVPNNLGIDELWALIVPRAQIQVEALAAHCKERLAPLFCPVRFVTVDRLPRNESGKIDRQRLREFVSRQD